MFVSNCYFVIQKASETNKVNRQKQVLSHTAGTKTFARFRDEMV